MRCWREGSKLVEVIDLTENQGKELTQYIFDCHRGPWLGNGNGIPTPEDEIAQWYRVIDLMNTHVTHYCAPTNDQHVAAKLRNPMEWEKGRIATATHVAPKLQFQHSEHGVELRMADILDRPWHAAEHAPPGGGRPQPP